MKLSDVKSARQVKNKIRRARKWSAKKLGQLYVSINIIKYAIVSAVPRKDHVYPYSGAIAICMPRSLMIL